MFDPRFPRPWFEYVLLKFLSVKRVDKSVPGSNCNEWAFQHYSCVPVYCTGVCWATISSLAWLNLANVFVNVIFAWDFNAYKKEITSFKFRCLVSFFSRRLWTSMYAVQWHFARRVANENSPTFRFIQVPNAPPRRRVPQRESISKPPYFDGHGQKAKGQWNLTKIANWYGNFH